MIGFRCRHSITKLESSHVGDSLVNAGLEGSGIFRSRCACILRREVILTESFDDHHQGAANGLPEDLRDHARLMCDIIAIAFQTDRTRVASLILARDLSAMYYPFREVREGHHGASHNNLSDGYERISRFHLSQLAYLATKLDSMPEGNGTVLDNSCLMFLSNLWIGRKHDNFRLPLVLAGGLGGKLETGRTLNYLDAGEENRKMCSLYLSLMDRFGAKLDQFGDAQTRLERL